jgi:hypothetical protein
MLHGRSSQTVSLSYRLRLRRASRGRSLGVRLHAEIREAAGDLLEQRVRLLEGLRPAAGVIGAPAGIRPLVGQRRDALGSV